MIIDKDNDNFYSQIIANHGHTYGTYLLTHTHTHTHTLTYIHAPTNLHAQAYILKHIPTHTHLCVQIYIETQAYTHTPTQAGNFARYFLVVLFVADIK